MSIVADNDSSVDLQLGIIRERRQNVCQRCIHKVSNGCINVLESLFYRLGFGVATYPWMTIVTSILICCLTAIGMKDFTESNDQAELWVPRNNRMLVEKQWVDRMFPAQTRYATIIATSENILAPSALNAIYDYYRWSLETNVHGNKLSSLCVKVDSICHVISILEFWFYNETLIRTMTFDDILRTVNAQPYSPLSKTDITTIVGKLQRDIHGKIIGAKAASLTWILQNSSKAADWEHELIGIANRGHNDLENTFVYTTRSFDEEIYGAVNNDIALLSIGFCLVFIYLVVTLGKFNRVEHKVYLSCVGLVSVGLSIVFAYGLALSIGILYGPIHSILPFLLLGLGVDDMFVIVGTWKNLPSPEEKMTLEEKIALTLKHAGVSVTVTSITDIVAFSIGASTVIPALSAFCIYAAIGIFALFALQSTFFVACLTLDQRRVDSYKDGCILCYKHHNYKPSTCSEVQFLPMIFEKALGPILMKLPVKILVIVLTLLLFAVNTWSFTQLRQDFDLVNYIPSTSYAYTFMKKKEEFFPANGIDAALYCGKVDYFRSKKQLENMYSEIVESRYFLNGSVQSWFMDYFKWMNGSYPNSNWEFTNNLKKFLSENSLYQKTVKFQNDNLHIIKASFMSIKHTEQPDSSSEIDAMQTLRDIVDNTVFPGGKKCFAYSPAYLTFETNKILQEELYRNLTLAAVAVFLVTLLLIANLWTSTLVFICVAFTVVDVIGTLQFWGVTIDTASSILIILTVGLAVDYSAHIGHTFMTIVDTRNERASATLQIIGPAVFNGGFSTFVAFILLANSSSYGFTLFFRVFSSVVFFGLFHGLIFLPVILSWIGPAPYWAPVSTQSC